MTGETMLCPIVRKVRAADSAPGVRGPLLGKTCYFYGAHEEERLQGPPGQILARLSRLRAA